MAQVSGRSGRKNKQGKVIIQTSDPKNYIIHDVIKNDFLHMYRTQLEERKNFGYPPFTRLIQLTLKHKDKILLDQAADEMAILLRKSFGTRVYGPEYPIISRINNWYQKNILLKIEKQASIVKGKELILQAMSSMASHANYHSVFIQPDVDPM